VRLHGLHCTRVCCTERPREGRRPSPSRRSSARSHLVARPHHHGITHARPLPAEPALLLQGTDSPRTPYVAVLVALQARPFFPFISSRSPSTPHSSSSSSTAPVDCSSTSSRYAALALAVPRRRRRAPVPPASRPPRPLAPRALLLRLPAQDSPRPLETDRGGHVLVLQEGLGRRQGLCPVRQARRHRGHGARRARRRARVRDGRRGSRGRARGHECRDRGGPHGRREELGAQGRPDLVPLAQEEARPARVAVPCVPAFLPPSHSLPALRPSRCSRADSPLPLPHRTARSPRRRRARRVARRRRAPRARRRGRAQRRRVARRSRARLGARVPVPARAPQEEPRDRGREGASRLSLSLARLPFECELVREA